MLTIAVLATVCLLACQAPEPVALPASHAVVEAPARPSPAATPAARYDLGPDEVRGGHTLARHVGRSDADLRDRLRREPGISAASTYTDRATAERVVALALARERPRIEHWLGRRGARPNLALDYHETSGRPLGRSLLRRSLSRRDQAAVDCLDAVVVLRWDGRSGFYVLTSYPEVRR